MHGVFNPSIIKVYEKPPIRLKSYSYQSFQSFQKYKTHWQHSYTGCSNYEFKTSVSRYCDYQLNCVKVPSMCNVFIVTQLVSHPLIVGTLCITKIAPNLELTLKINIFEQFRISYCRETLFNFVGHLKPAKRGDSFDI